MSRIRIAILSFLILAGSVALINEVGPVLIPGDWFTAAVGWANILAGVLAILVPVALLSPAFDSPDSAAARLLAERNALARRIRIGEGSALSKLIAIDENSETRSIDLKFTRSLLQYRSAGGAATGSMAGIAAYFNSLEPNRLIILGDSGIGKTVMALDLMRQLLGDPARTDRDPIPVRFALASYDNEETLTQWLSTSLVSAYGLRPQAAELLVDNGEILPILDGLDELDSDSATLQRANSVVNVINDYLYAGRASPIVVTCRTTTYAALSRGIREATEIIIDPIDVPTCVAYLSRQYEEPSEELAWVNVVDGLQGVYGLAVSTNLLATLSTPWRIGASISAVRSGPVTADEIFYLRAPFTGGSPTPRSPGEAQIRILRAFVSVRSKVYSGCQRSRYSEQDLARWLRYIAVHLRAQIAAGRPSDIRLENWWMARPRASRVLHCALVLLIAAGCAYLLYEALGGVAVLAPADLRQYLARWRDLDPAFLYGSLTFALSGGLTILAGLRISIRSRIVSNRFSIRSLRRFSGLSIILIGLVGGGIIGGAIGLGVGVAGGLSVAIRQSLLIGLIGGATAGLVFGLSSAARQARSDRDGPSSAVTDDALYGLTFATILGMLASVGGTISIGLRFGLLVGAVVFVWSALVVSSQAAVRYAITIALLTLSSKRMPVRFGRMLSWSAGAGILRQVGATYQFRQEELQKAFADGKI